jgi:hypothetical protein
MVLFNWFLLQIPREDWHAILVAMHARPRRWCLLRWASRILGGET